MSRYLSSKVIVAAFNALKDAGMGSTDLSALRYCLALDAFAKEYGRNCSLRKGSQDKDRFIDLVDDVVAIDTGGIAGSPSYIDNFNGDKPKKGKLASQISSNFFTANAVRQSRGKSGELYPSGKDKYLFNVSDEVLEASSLNYAHISHYLPTAETRVAFAVWVARYDEVQKGSMLPLGLRAALLQRYSKALVDALLDAAGEDLTSLGVSDDELFGDSKPLITWDMLFSNSAIEYHFVSLDKPRNWIFFGAPGTGKSYQLNKQAEAAFGNNVRRVTFYPDYTYSQFVGCFKPVTRYKGRADETTGHLDTYISYEFVPGPFLETYIDAVRNPEENYLLIVEEINRANPAAVFGDVFQLLDRDGNGRSEYEIAVPREMNDYLTVFLPEFATAAHISDPTRLLSEQKRLEKESERLSLPPNMYIWATMNSADQGVFPMDTAFKRRWSFRYIGIDDGEDAEVTIGEEKKRLNEVVVSWGDGNDHKANWNNLRKAINGFLSNDVKVNEDKLLGPFFVNPASLADGRFADAFKDKVLLYLYEDACKTKHSKVFAGDLNTYSAVCDSFDERGIDIFVDGFKKHYKEETTTSGEDADSSEE